MNKPLYISLIVFLGLTAASGIWDSIISFQVGAEIYTLDSYVAWFLVENITIITGSILLLKYYYHHNYRFAFFTGIISAIASLGYAIIFYHLGELRSYYLPVMVVDIGAIVVYTASLTFSSTRKRYWLRLGRYCWSPFTRFVSLSSHQCTN